MGSRDLTGSRELLPALLARLARQGGSSAGLQAVWANAVGTPLARHARVVALDGDVLCLQVTSPAWAQTLARQELQLCERFNAQVGPPGVRTLRFQVG